MSFLFLIFPFYLVLGQSAYPSTQIKEEVKALFDKKVKNIWVILISGKLDGIHVVDLAFGTDGKSCKGFYYLRSSGERFELDGDEQNSDITFVETNKRGKSTGFIIGHFDGQQFKGKWMDAFKKESLGFEGEVVNKFDDYHPILCGGREWHHFYKGKIDNMPICVFIDKKEDTYTVFSKLNQNIFTDTLLLGDNEEVIVFMISPHYKAILTKDAQDYLLIEKSENYQNFLLKREASAVFECFEFANFTTRIETMRPLIDHKKFNHWLDNEFKNWHNSSHKKISVTSEESIPNTNRYKDIGYGWVEISFLNDEFVSGNIFTQSSWKKGTDKKSFVFDLKSGKILEPIDFLALSFEHPLGIDSLVQVKKNALTFRDKSVKEWVSKQNFNYICLYENGIKFQTCFSNIYGEHEVELNFDELRPLCKSKSILKNF